MIDLQALHLSKSSKHSLHLDAGIYKGLKSYLCQSDNAHFAEVTEKHCGKEDNSKYVNKVGGGNVGTQRVKLKFHHEINGSTVDFRHKFISHSTVHLPIKSNFQ